MGNIMSTRPASAGQETQALTGGKDAEQLGPLFLGDIDAEPAAWTQESKCVMIRRFLGWLPDSPAEKLKQEQSTSVYIPCVVTVRDVVTSSSRAQAILIVQRVYRRYRLMRKWHLVGYEILELARNILDERAAAEDEEELLNNFRQYLSTGFSAQKVSITGKLKNIQLQLVLKAAEEACYLTWTPSRKRNARIHLHEIQEVVPVLREGNKHAPRLASKVSHRRGLIIVCKSHHRGRVVLQMSSKRERKILLLGFQRLLDDLNRFDPRFDEAGTIRKGLPRRKSAIEFFDPAQRTASGGAKVDGDTRSNSEELPEGSSSETQVLSPIKSTKRSSIERLYETRFDDSLTKSRVSAAMPEVKPSLGRRSSVVV